jgi:hypothetical protein
MTWGDIALRVVEAWLIVNALVVVLLMIFQPGRGR